MRESEWFSLGGAVLVLGREGVSEQPGCIILLFLSSYLSAVSAKTKTWTNNESIRTQRPSILTLPRPLCGV